MKITTLAKLGALGGAAYYINKHGGLKPAFEKLKESLKGLADQAKPAVEDTLKSASSTTERVATDISGTPRFGSTLGSKTSY